jgi:hypothetical protein
MAYSGATAVRLSEENITVVGDDVNGFGGH